MEKRAFFLIGMTALTITASAATDDTTATDNSTAALFTGNLTFGISFDKNRFATG